MLDMLLRLEVERQMLRRKLLCRLQGQAESFLGLGLIVLGVLLTPAVLPVTVIAFSPLVSIILLFAAIGLLLVLTVVFAPLGLVLL